MKKIIDTFDTQTTSSNELQIITKAEKTAEELMNAMGTIASSFLMWDYSRHPFRYLKSQKNFIIGLMILGMGVGAYLKLTED